MAKVKRYDGEDESLVTEKRVNLANPSSYKVPQPEAEIEDEGDRGEMTEGQKANNYATRQMEIEDESDRGVMQKAKPKVVTKEQMKAAGYDNLRDYLNATNPGGPLKRRDGSAPEKSAASTPAKTTPVAVTKEKTTVSALPRGQAKAFDTIGNKTTEEGLARMRAKDEAIRNAPGPLDNLKSLGKKLREKAGITSYKKGGMTKSSASSRGDGIAQRGKTRGTLVMCGGGMSRGKK